MAPLAPFGDRVSVLQGITGGFGGVYHKGNYRPLAATAADSGNRARIDASGWAQTIDSVLARALPAPVTQLCVGFDSRAASGLSYIPLSAADRGKPNAFYSKPSRAYADLFGVIDTGSAKARYDVQSSVLDFHAADVKRLQAQVAGPEREQMDRYLGAFDDLRQSRSEIQAMTDRLRKYAPAPPGDVDISDTIAIAAAHSEIAATSLISGLTNVATICFDQLSLGSLHGSVGHGQGGNVLGKRQTDHWLAIRADRQDRREARRNPRSWRHNAR